MYTITAYNKNHQELFSSQCLIYEEVQDIYHQTSANALDLRTTRKQRIAYFRTNFRTKQDECEIFITGYGRRVAIRNYQTRRSETGAKILGCPPIMDMPRVETYLGCKGWVLALVYGEGNPFGVDTDDHAMIIAEATRSTKTTHGWSGWTVVETSGKTTELPKATKQEVMLALQELAFRYRAR
jgi:hypothetical protein